MPEASSTHTIAGLILAGGVGRRMGGADKGLVAWQGRPLVDWVMAALIPVVTPVLISANRSLDDYRRYSDWLVSDALEFRWQGPLAGLLAGMRAAGEQGCQAVLVSSCDTPNVTPALFRALLEAYQASPDVPVFARAEGRQHPLHGVYPVALAPMLEDRLRAGDRRVMGFTQAAGARELDIEPASLFSNFNRPEQLSE